MRINKLRIRAAAVVLGGGVLAAMAAFGGGTADAATTCSASNGHQIERTVGHGGCGAKAGPGSTAFAEDSSDAGTARSHALRPTMQLIYNICTVRTQ